MTPHARHAGRLAAALLAFVALAAPGWAEAQVIEASAPAGPARPALANEATITELPGGRVPADVRLTDATGQAVRLGDYLGKGRPVVLAFAYHSCPMLCSIVLDGYAAALRDLDLVAGRDYTPLTVSFDPRDTPARSAAVKARYAEAVGKPEAAAAWHFLTGEADETRRLADAVGFGYARDARTGEYAHAAALIFLTPDGRVARYLYGASFPARDVRLALVEASEGRVGNTLDRFLLTCYRYDPDARSYTPYALGFMKLGGVLLLAVLAALLVPLWRRERARQTAEDAGAARAGDPAPE